MHGSLIMKPRNLVILGVAWLERRASDDPDDKAVLYPDHHPQDSPSRYKSAIDGQFVFARAHNASGCCAMHDTTQQAHYDAPSGCKMPL